MPFRPYGGGYGGGRDPLEMLLMLQNLQAQKQAADERRASQGLEMMMNLAGVLEPGEFASAAGALAQDFNVPQAQLQFATTINKAGAKRRKEQAGRGLFNNAGVAQAAPGLTGTPQQRKAAEQAIRTAGAGAEPHDVETYISGARAGLEAEQQRQMEYLRQQRIEQERAAAQQESRRALQERQDEFYKNALTQVLNDVGTQPKLIQEAAGRFGTGYAREVEQRLATAHDTALASALGEQEALKQIIGDTDAPPELARLYVKGKAQKDPNTGFLFYGNEATGARVAAMGHIYTVLGKYEVAAEQFAREVGGTAVTGFLSELEEDYAGGGYPAFNTLQALEAEYNDAMLRLRTGAVINEEELKQAARLNPAKATLNIRNGRLLPTARARFAAMRDNAEGLYLAPFDRRQREDVRSVIRSNANAELDRIRRDPNSWYSIVEGSYSNEGARLLQQYEQETGGR